MFDEIDHNTKVALVFIAIVGGLAVAVIVANIVDAFLMRGKKR